MIKARVRALVARADALQRRHALLGFPIAVVRKFGDDHAGNLAALIAYYAFFSIFPLLLALVTILGYVLRGHPGLQKDILNSALASFPVLGNQLRRSVESLHGNAFALAVGIAGLLWAGMAAMNAGQTAMNTVWRVPMKQWPNAIRSRVRALLMLVLLGGGTLVSTVIAGFGGFSGAPGALTRSGAIVLTFALNFGLFLAAFRILPNIDPAWRDLWPGAVVAGLGWTLLQTFGGYVVRHELSGASETYGTFAFVIGLLSWLFLQAQLTLFASEINVVRAWRLWPRGLSKDDPTEPDRRALARYAEIEERVPDEDVEVELGRRAASPRAAPTRRVGLRDGGAARGPSPRSGARAPG